MKELNYISPQGYRWIRNPKPFNERSKRYVLEHRAIAEHILGKSLPDKAEIHHIDNNGLNNSNHNFVICENRAYHMLLHQRERALRACGHADWLKCRICKKYDDPDNLKQYKTQIIHLSCQNQYRKERGMNTAKYRKEHNWKSYS